VPADGSGKPSVILEGKWPQWPSDASPDGRVLAYYVNSPQSLRDLWTLPTTAGASPTVFLAGAFQERAPRFSPDGRWIAYVSNESGRDEIYVRPFPGPGGQIAISTTGGTQPVWSKTSGELLFRSAQTLMAVTIDTSATLSASAPRTLFDAEDFVTDVGPSGSAQYDAHADGKRVLMLTAVSVSAKARVVLNWFDELRKLFPPD
jgi:Tol biopolymer transport system component